MARQYEAGSDCISSHQWPSCSTYKQLVTVVFFLVLLEKLGAPSPPATNNQYVPHYFGQQGICRPILGMEKSRKRDEKEIFAQGSAMPSTYSQ